MCLFTSYTLRGIVLLLVFYFLFFWRCTSKSSLHTKHSPRKSSFKNKPKSKLTWPRIQTTVFSFLVIQMFVRTLTFPQSISNNLIKITEKKLTKKKKEKCAIFPLPAFSNEAYKSALCGVTKGTDTSPRLVAKPAAEFCFRLLSPSSSSLHVNI